MTFNARKLAASAIILSALCAPANALEACARPEEATTVAEIYETIPGAPPLIAARRLRIGELKVLDAMTDIFAKVHGTQVTPETTRDIYKTIENWGADTEIHMIFSMGGYHVADIPTSVPIRQPDDGSGFIDIYADDGAGVHGHIYLDLVKYAYAAEIPRDDGNTRMVSFYDGDGKLISGFYASLAGKPFEEEAVTGWEKSFEFMATLPPACD